MKSAERFTVMPAVTYETIDDELVIINLDNGHYYSMVDVGVEIWSLVSGGACLQEVVDELLARYHGKRSDIEDSVTRLTAQLMTKGLLAPDPTPGNAPQKQGPSTVEEQGQKERRAFEQPVLCEYTDMQDLLLLDPIHAVDEQGWPRTEKK